MTKLSLTAVLVLAVSAGVAYLALDPHAARDLSNWVKRQVGDAPDAKGLGHPNYAPVLPGR